jgi:hypothetical protein
VEEAFDAVPAQTHMTTPTLLEVTRPLVISGLCLLSGFLCDLVGHPTPCRTQGVPRTPPLQVDIAKAQW